MLTNYVIYDNITGQIYSAGYTSDASTISPPTGQSYLVSSAGQNGDLYYVVVAGPTLTLRPSQTLTWSGGSSWAHTTTGSLTGIVNPSTVTVDNATGVYAGNTLPQTATVTSGTLTLAITPPGSYQVTVSSFPYLDTTLGFTVT